MSRPVLITGGTGTLGRVVVDKLLEKGLRPRVLSRRPKNSGDPAGAGWVTGDLLTGDRVADAVADVAAIVHCASNSRNPVEDVHATRRLIETALRGGSPHLIYVSIVGCDRIPRKLYRYKTGIEGIVQRCGLPWTIQRATQFHDLVLTIRRTAARPPVMPLPSGIRMQPIDTPDVAERLIRLAVGEPVGREADLGGPLVQTLPDLASQYLHAAGKRRPMASLWVPGRIARRYREGWNLAPDHADGTVTFEQFLTRAIRRDR